MHSEVKNRLLQKCQLEVGTFYLYDHFMISEINEGMAMDFENARELLALAKEHYGTTTPFVYITNRVNAYSFNPTAHFKTTAMFPNLKGYAMVIYDSINDEIADMEQAFVNRPSKKFHSLKDAIAWADTLIAEK